MTGQKLMTGQKIRQILIDKIKNKEGLGTHEAKALSDKSTLNEIQIYDMYSSLLEASK